MEIKNYYDTVKRGLLSGPLTVQLEISGKCIARCVACNNINHKKDFHPSKEQVLKMIKTLKESGVKAIRLTGGEPILANNFDEIVKYCKDSNIQTSIITTLLTTKEKILNALLDVDRLHISLSGMEHNYKYYFGIENKNFNLVKDAMKFLNDNGKKFSVNYTVIKENSDKESLMKFIEFINEYKTNYVTFFPALYYTHEENKQIIQNFKEVAPYLKGRSGINNVGKHFSLRKKEKEKVICHMNKFHWYIKRNGDVLPCCLHGNEIGDNEGNKIDKRFILGNLLKEEAKDIYKNKYNIFTNKNLAKVKKCNACTPRYTMLNSDFDGFINDKSKINEI